jgi:uncharacterized protein (TIGR02265 family)
MRFTVRPSDKLQIPFEPEERLARIPSDMAVKGMFFGRLVSALGPDWKLNERKLLSPPRLGTYLPFSDYPLVDYERLTIAAAQKRFPRLPLAEAIRVHERDSVQAFADSTVGKVMLKMASDLHAAMLKVPDIQRMVVRNGTISAVSTGPRSVRIEFRNARTWFDCAVLGNFEGAVLMYRESPVIDLDVIDDENARYDISW